MDNGGKCDNDNDQLIHNTVKQLTCKLQKIYSTGKCPLN